MRLHRASFPDEASLRCSLLEPCVMGLTRGFAVASDLAGTAQSVIIQNQIRAGRWLSADGAVGFQFLEGVDKTFWANGSLGWRRMLYEDSNNNEVKISGFTGSIDFAQEISGFYTQGLHFESMFSRDNSLSTGDRIYENSNRGAHARRAVNSLFEYSHRRPTFWLSLPADAELLNWKASHIDLPSDIRGYVHAEPFFAQNELVLDDGFSWVEQDFGLRTGVVGAYESDRDRVSGRFALKGHAGVELAFTREKHKTERAESGVVFELPQRAAVSAYLDLSASWQF